MAVKAAESMIMSRNADSGSAPEINMSISAVNAAIIRARRSMNL
jgi:hypothetical protein